MGVIPPTRPVQRSHPVYEQDYDEPDFDPILGSSNDWPDYPRFGDDDGDDGLFPRGHVLMILILALCFIYAILVYATSSFSQEPKPASKIVLLEFTATWCGPCQGMKPMIRQLKREGLDIRTVDIDRNKKMASMYGVSRVPTFVSMQILEGGNGQEIARKVGVMPEAQVRRMAGRPAAR